MTEPMINVIELAEYIKRKRQDERLSLREAAEETNVSAATLSRIENGIGVPDSKTLARLAGWLGIPLDRLMKGSLMTRTAEGNEPIIYYPSESTPAIIEAHLRADPNLKPDTAKALAELFRVAYHQFTGPAKEPSADKNKGAKASKKKGSKANKNRGRKANKGWKA
ncbi:MAG: helix-turn-helix transcriptional regulator [Acidobacteriota bacterium]